MTGTRTATVAVLVTGALTAVLIAWFGAGWRAAHRDRDALEAKARAQAEDAAADAAAAVVEHLEELRATESQRPYYHYQNLFHDPRGASEGRSVVPSPLAGGPLDPLVAIHFQYDAGGALTAPSVNDEVPDNAGNQAVDRALLAGLDHVRAEVITPGDPALIAMATPPPAPKVEAVSTRPVVKVRKPGIPAAFGKGKVAVAEEDDDDEQVASAEDAPSPADLVAQLDTSDKPVKRKLDEADFAKKKPVKRAPEPKQQVVALDPDVYVQNSTANQIFTEARNRKGNLNVEPVQQQLKEPPKQSALGNGADGAVSEQRPAVVQQQQAPRPRPVVKPAPAPAPGPVFITVSPLGWRAAMLGDEPSLLAVRQVTTPDGVLTQGLVVDRAEVVTWLAQRGGPAATVVTEEVDGPSAPIGLGGAHWWVAVDAEAALAEARAAGAGLERAFLGRFVPVAALAALCAGLVVLLTARAERLARQRARFAAAAAHELRTPLAGIQLYGDMLVDGLGDPKRHKDYARRVAEEASRLGRVVANVLGFSQLERGSLAVRPEAADLSAAVQAIVERSEAALTRAGAIVVVDAPPGIRARFDPDALARIVGNLLDNAEKYSREHEDRSISVTVRPGPELAEIVVVDHGPGLPAALRKRRFRPFARGAGDDGPPGLGLGLALSQNLATSMGGSLTWRDQEHGAAFVVSVPMAADPPKSA